ncbi:MAG: cysteine hydrolase [Myxococcota bacterium]
MPLDLSTLVDPRHTALVTQEIQRGVVGDLAEGLPELAQNARETFPQVARLCAAARGAGMPVIHATAVRRRDGLGANDNARIFQAMKRVEGMLAPGSESAEIVPEVPVADSDLVLPRYHGMSPFQGTEIDFILRNLGVTTIVGVGVSVNVAITNFAFDAVNSSYQMVIPRDAVAGFPQEYVEAVFANTLSAVATLVQTDDIARVWEASA